MPQKRQLTPQEIQKQSVYTTSHWNVLFPKRPVNPLHLMVVANRQDAKVFTNLNDEELIELRQVIEFIIKVLSDGEKLTGYNLFSNNGSYKIGQHLDHFHQHIFVRTKDETESPFIAMADGRRWAEVDSGEWLRCRDELRELLN